MSQLQEVFLFQPTQISGCQLWLDATDPNGTGTPPANGSTLSTWKDKSSNGFSGTAVNSPVFRTNIQNQLPGIQFNGTNQYINFGNVVNLGTSKIYAFAVTQFTGDGSIVAKSSLRGFAGRWFLIRFAGDGGMEFGADATGSGVIAPFADSTTVTQLVMGSWDRTTVATFQNGTQKASASLSNSSSLSNTDILLVGAYGNPSGSGPQSGFYLNGFIYEILVFLTDMTTFQRQQIEGYLAWKWGLQALLPSSHPFKTYRPLRTGTVPTSIPPMPITNQNTGIFLPTQFSGCAIWLDATDVNGDGTTPANSSAVAAWADKSGNRRNFVQTTAGNQPTYGTFLSAPGISFSGASSTRLSNAYIQTGSGARTTFIVFYDVSTSANTLGNPPLFNMAQTFSVLGEWRTAFDGANNYLGIDAVQGAYLYRNIPNVTTMRSARCIGMWGYASGSAFNTSYVYGNGTQFTTLVNSVANTGTLNVQNTGVSQVGGARTGYVTSVISEVIHYTAELTTEQRQQVEGYLAWKWGLVASLPSNHPYKQAPIYPFTFRSTPIVYSLSTWQPIKISGMSLWLDAADSSTVTLSGTSVTAWRDKSGNSNSTTTVGGSPVYNNSTSSILLNGSSTYLFGPYVNTTTTITAFVIGTVDFSSGVYGYYYRLLSVGSSAANDYGNAAYAALILHEPNTTNIGGYRNSATNYVSVSTNTRFLLAQQYNGTTGTAFLNGTQGGQTNSSGSFNTSSYSIGRDVGNIDTGINPAPIYSYTYWPGSISEVILYNASLSTAQRQQVEGYLAWKWGLVGSLPANHPFKLWPPSP